MKIHGGWVTATVNDSALDEGNETLLLEVVGPRFLQYTLNTDEPSLIGYFHGSSLGVARDAALKELALVLGHLIPEPDTDPLLRQGQLDVLGSFVADQGTSYSNTLRIRCGGLIDAEDSSDPVVDHILPLARDMYPLFLLPLPPEPSLHAFAPAMTRSMFGHPGRALFNEAVIADAELSRLFPEDGQHTGRSGHVISSAGRGGGVQLVMFAELIIRNSWSWLSLERAVPTLSEFLAGVAQSVERIRHAVMGRPVSVPVRIGLTGVRLPEQASRALLPWGVMRPMQDLDRTMIPSSLAGASSVHGRGV